MKTTTKIVPCEHDYKNAIEIGGGRYLCQLCRELVNPLEWFLANECGCTFVTSKKVKKKRTLLKKIGKINRDEEQLFEKSAG